MWCKWCVCVCGGASGGGLGEGQGCVYNVNTVKATDTKGRGREMTVMRRRVQGGKKSGKKVRVGDGRREQGGVL